MPEFEKEALILAEARQIVGVFDLTCAAAMELEWDDLGLYFHPVLLFNRTTVLNIRTGVSLHERRV